MEKANTYLGVEVSLLGQEANFGMHEVNPFLSASLSPDLHYVDRDSCFLRIIVAKLRCL